MKVKLAIKMKELAEKYYDKSVKGIVTYIERFAKQNAKRGLREYVYYIDEDERDSVNWDRVKKHFEQQGFEVECINKSAPFYYFKITW